MSEMADVSRGAKVWGWVILIAGFLALLAPFVTGLGVAVVVTVLLVVAGISRLIDAFQGGGGWSGLFGALSVAAGLVMLGRPLLGLATLTLVLAAYFLATGVAEIVAAFRVRPAQGWGFVLFSGIVSVVLGLLIWTEWPLSGAWAIGVLVGIQLAFAGLTMITVGSVLKQARGA